ncbi:MAG: hypothetical protein BroJett018_03560 [Chloroflexota bacterium]|nr:hypothetical protein [Chloroflexota bacterium]NOG61849.1 hypothetical protein [Chloroflexota bacterium]GIK62562.1 MAG: hypothetical protein BroJett018_03560 [Chloroflexota bacterium]
MAVGGRDPKKVDWHKIAKPYAIKNKLRQVRTSCGTLAVCGGFLLYAGIVMDDFIVITIGLLLVLAALAILIQWELIKKDYAKNYKKNLRQWKKTKKNNTGRN